MNGPQTSGPSPSRSATAVRPVLVSYSDAIGGASRAAHRLHCALRSAGLPSRMLVRHRQHTDPDVLQYQGRGTWLAAAIRRRLDASIVRLDRDGGGQARSLNVMPTRVSAALDRLDANVVNVHWIGSGSMSVADVGRVSRPVVMTLHDMWGFTGAEHYASDDPDARWRLGYPRLTHPGRRPGIDVDRWTWRRKARHWKPVQVVAPSRWLAQCVADSALMADWDVHTIPNPLDTDTFRPIEGAHARQLLRLPPTGDLVLFAALDATDPRKGADLMVSAMGRLADREGTTLVALGDGFDLPRPPGVDLIALGRMSDDVALSLAYNACDVMVVPSRLDNLPQSATEAQACGTPVVAFDVGGLGDAVVDGVTGYLARPASDEDLAAKISRVLDDTDHAAQLGAAARQRAVERWSPGVVADQYLTVYRRAIRLGSGGRPDGA